MGPTASGKTDLAVALREHLAVEIISVDASQVYRQMDIGTAKPDRETLQRAPHRLIDIRDPGEPYSVAEFVADARQAMAEISANGRIPLLAGGTMLYFRALLQGLADLPSGDKAIRADIEKQAEQQGWPHMHALLAENDPETAARLHPNHSQRIARALEVLRITGEPLSMWLARHQRGEAGTPPIGKDYELYQMALVPAQRDRLHARIATRFEGMLTRGLLEEVVRLRGRSDLSTTLPSMRAVGYRQVWQHLDGELSYEDMATDAVAATRQLAKRQLTWLRNWSMPATSHSNGMLDETLHCIEPDSLSVQQMTSKALKILRKGAIYKKQCE